MINLYDHIHSTHWQQLSRAVKSARKMGEAYAESSAQLIQETFLFTCDPPITAKDVKEFLFPPLERFFLDGYDEVDLISVDAGMRWNGFAVPSPTYAELAEYLWALSSKVDHGEWVGMAQTLLDCYGGDGSDEGEESRHTYGGLTWQKRPADD